MNSENFLPLPFGRQVHEKDFVKPAFPHHLRRQLGNIVRGRHDEDRLGFLLHPGQELPEDPGGRAAVPAARNAAEAFFNLVDPKDTWRNRLRRFDRFAHVAFAAADDAREDPGHVQA
ncbi:hypothetical protein D1872_264520 [compost metagenome]